MSKKTYSKVDREYFRAYSWALVTYHELSTINSFLDKFVGVVTHYAFIKHYKDLDRETNKPEVLHYHLLIVLRREKSLRFLQTELDSLAGFHQNTFGIRIVDKVREFNYLTHKDEEDECKFKYPDTDVCHNGIDYWLDESKQKLEVADILADFDNKTSLRYMAIKYGRDFMKNFSSYYNFYLLVKAEESKNKQFKIVDCDEKDLPF